VTTAGVHPDSGSFDSSGY